MKCPAHGRQVTFVAKGWTGHDWYECPEPDCTIWNKDQLTGKVSP